MKKMQDQKLTVSVVIPVFNSASTMIETLKSLNTQADKFNELVIINDGSTDNSLSLIENFLKNNFKQQEVFLIKHKTSKGLANSYNEGIKLASSSLVITMHSDVVLVKNAIEKLVNPFKDSNVVASYHVVNHPLNVWKKYNFWQKYFFSRLVGKKFFGLDGKFDCFRRGAILKIGLFDSRTFFRAGEDGDIVIRLKKIGKVVKTGAEIVHLHSTEPSFGIKKIIYKQAQYSEAQGVLLRKGRIATTQQFFKAFFREMLLLSLFIPFLNKLSFFLTIIYAFAYSWPMFKYEYSNPRIVILPFLNIYLLLVSFIYLVRGFIYGRQRI